MGVCPSNVGCWRSAEKDKGDRADAHEAKIGAAAELSVVDVATRSRMREMTVCRACFVRGFGSRENHVEHVDDDEAVGRVGGADEGLDFSSTTVERDSEAMVS